MVRRRRGVVSSVVVARAGVDGGLPKPADVVEKAVMGLLGDGVGVGKAEVGIGDDLGLGPQLVAKPANADVLDILDRAPTPGPVARRRRGRARRCP